MFARTVECQAKRGQSEEMNTRVNNDVVPTLQKQPGFVEFLALSDKSDPERVLCISLWNTREDADKHQREHYDVITSLLTPFLESSPTLGTFTVNASTAHRIAVSRAA